MAEATTVTPVSTLTPTAVTTSAGLTGAVGTVQPMEGGKRAIVRVRSSVDCCLEFSQSVGTDPTATTDSMELSANQHEYFEVLVGTKISVIRASSAVSDGVLKVTICEKRA